MTDSGTAAAGAHSALKEKKLKCDEPSRGSVLTESTEGGALLCDFDHLVLHVHACAHLLCVHASS